MSPKGVTQLKLASQQTLSFSASNVSPHARFLSMRPQASGSAINPLHPNISMHILHNVLCTFPKENLLSNQELHWLVIIFFLLVTLMCELGVMLSGEIRCLLLRLKIQRAYS